MIGHISLIMALIVSILTVLAYSIGQKTGLKALFKVGKSGVIVICGLFTVASIWLFYLLFTRDFQNAYVFGYTSSDLPWFYTFSAFWAGQEGSLLLWAWISSILIVIVVKGSRYYDKNTSHAATILIGINIAFLILLIFFSNPFERLEYLPPDGYGLNPVLRDPGMVIHPPVLFLGYAGFAVPFAFAMAGLLTGDDNWIKRARSWVLFAWISLGVGIALGGWWAYHALGWGGYWAWDPVENASLLPWLTGTALLHSMIIQDKRGGMKVWNILLAIFTFVLIIYGTFLTRSGASPLHSFEDSGSSIIYLGFIAVLLISSLGLLFLKLRNLEGRELYESLLSKETTFLTNILIFVVLTLVILLGTLYPLISQAMMGFQVDVGADYYNNITVPIGGFLILLIGICPLLAWKKTSPDRLKKLFIFPIILSIIASIIAFAHGIVHFYAVCTVFISVFTISTHGIEFLKASRSKDKYALSNLLNAIGRNHRRYGGYVVHLAIVIMVIGIIGSSVYDNEETFILGLSESYEMDEYAFTYGGTVTNSTSDKESYIAIMDITKDGDRTSTATPSVERFTKWGVKGNVYIYGTGFEDIYIIYGPEANNRFDFFYENYVNGQGVFSVKILPLISLIWFGTLIMFLGTLLALSPDVGKVDDEISKKKSLEDARYDKRFEEELRKFKEGKK
ncbi:MAG: cytochrome c-type biogenesis CcmF C-terminal domain-containing protein [Halobacteriota archaeon]|nr:cytochrome c-type biogenesis CcmF C-terminal domain-containing protein [Halobacteriota archaeon]